MTDLPICSDCGQEIPAEHEACPRCSPAVAAKAAPPPPAPAAPPAPPPGRPHSPVAALVLAVLLPGAGQAYNGHPFKALFFFFTSALVLPWAWSLWDAHRAAKRLVAEGGRYGRGGWVWVLLQAWMAVNVVLLTLIVLTLAGVLT